jgi:hypothetical protein
VDILHLLLLLLHLLHLLLHLLLLLDLLDHLLLHLLLLLDLLDHLLLHLLLHLLPKTLSFTQLDSLDLDDLGYVAYVKNRGTISVSMDPTQTNICKLYKNIRISA